MSDPFAIDANDDALVGTDLSLPKPLQVRIARHVSNILAPVTVSLPFVALVALYHANNALSVVLYTLLTLLFLSLGPMAYILIAVRRGKISDLDVSRRAERVGPFLFGIASVTIGLFVLFYLQAPKNLETLLIITAISGVIMMVTTFWWKISIHASSLAASVTMLTALYGRGVLSAFALVVLVSWSRVVLRRHTVRQVIAGAVVSIVLAVVILYVRGI